MREQHSSNGFIPAAERSVVVRGRLEVVHPRKVEIAPVWIALRHPQWKGNSRVLINIMHQKPTHIVYHISNLACCSI